MSRILLLLLFAALPACGASDANLVAAGISSTVAVGAAAYQGTHGDCFAVCQPGTTCNPKSGYCDTTTCAGQCRPGETCEVTPTGQRCIVPETPTLLIETSAPAWKDPSQPDEPPVPIDPYVDIQNP